jgi:hypothetical protein
MARTDRQKIIGADAGGIEGGRSQEGRKAFRLFHIVILQLTRINLFRIDNPARITQAKKAKTLESLRSRRN